MSRHRQDIGPHFATDKSGTDIAYQDSEGFKLSLRKFIFLS